MELRHLRYFVAVAEELHFRRAAERLHVAQPAVSEQVRKLEEELGVKLLERTHRSVSLTEAGAVMLDQARVVLRLAKAAQHAARHASARATIRLRIGYTAAALPSVVPLPAAASGLRVTELGDQNAVAAVSVGHDHATRSAINLEQVAPERLLVLPRDANRPFYDAIVAACHQSGLSPTLVELPDADVERALLAVASGAGIALLPESVAERYAAPGVRFVPLAGSRPTFAIGVVTRRDSEHLPTAAFVRALSRSGQRPPVETPAHAAEPSLAFAA